MKNKIIIAGLVASLFIGWLFIGNPLTNTHPKNKVSNTLDFQSDHVPSAHMIVDEITNEQMNKNDKPLINKSLRHSLETSTTNQAVTSSKSMQSIEKNALNSKPLVLTNIANLNSNNLVLSHPHDIIKDFEDFDTLPKSEFETYTEYRERRTEQKSQMGLTGEHVYFIVKNKIGSRNFKSGLVEYDPVKNEFFTPLQKNIFVDSLLKNTDSQQDYFLSFNNIKEGVSGQVLTYPLDRKEAEEISGYLSILYIIQPENYIFRPYSAHGKIPGGFYLNATLKQVLIVEQIDQYIEETNKVKPTYNILKSINFEEFPNLVKLNEKPE